MRSTLVSFSMGHPRWIMAATVVLVLAGLAQLPRIRIDTDPENMLPADQPERVAHEEIKQRFGLSDLIVVGVVNERHPEGVFQPRSLAALHRLSREIEQIDGVVARDLMSLATVDNITQEGPGTLRFEWMMNTPPESEEQALEIRSDVMRLPLLRNTLVSADGRAAGIYIPIERKDMSHRIAEEVRSIVAGLDSDDDYHITGLPVAEDTFGVEMFRQMATSAPLAGLIIFVMMWIFFRNLSLIVAPMLLAIATVLITMGALIGAGFTVHIMSSMIPIFLMPIAVVDSVHLLSEFTDRHRPGRPAEETLRDVLGHLFVPMLYTSITSAVGFASLALTPIPPVRVFGLFVALGIVLAFLLTVTFLPAYVMMLSPARIEALAAAGGGGEGRGGLVGRLVRPLGPLSTRFAKPVLAVAAVVLVLSAVGVTQIRINDNPVRWFAQGHPIRVADRVLNEHFAGTYNAFLVVEGPSADEAEADYREAAAAIAADNGIADAWDRMLAESGEGSFVERLEQISFALGDRLFEAEGDALAVWERLVELTEERLARQKYFQNPEALALIERLEGDLAQSPSVGKTNSVAGLVKTVYRELRGGDEEQFRVPDTQRGVAQTLLSFQSSHRPYDLWHMVTPDYDSSAIWVQLSSGDNRDMVAALETVRDSELPEGVSLHWGGLTYINVVWQQAMVSGMARSLVGSFVVVWLIMVVLFRSFSFGSLAMVPLTFTITLIYGLIGFVGRDYDMPIAVLSSLTLGLSVDFAIHFLERARSLQRDSGSWSVTLRRLFEEPARAIGRNALVVAIGFLPLLATPLVPYRTVGMFLATIMAVSCFATLILLPALLQLARRRLLGEARGEKT